MFCKNCGRQLDDSAAFCPSCGTKRSAATDSYGEGRSNADMKNLPSYTKENDLHKSGIVIDSDRKKFSLTGDGRKQFSLSDGGRKPFSLNSKPADEPKRDDGFVRANTVSANPVPPPPPPPVMKPAPTMAKPAPAAIPAKPAEPVKPAEPAPEQTVLEPEEPTGFVNPLKGQTETGAFSNDAEPTGFVNPMKGQQIHWGSDGDRNEQSGGKTPIDPETINSHMGFAIFCTLCCCLPTGIAAIVFASQVSKHIKDGNYEQAQKSANTAQTLCWVSIILYFALSIFSSVLGAISEAIGLGVSATP